MHSFFSYISSKQQNLQIYDSCLFSFLKFSYIYYLQVMEASRKNHHTFSSLMHPNQSQAFNRSQKRRQQSINVPYHRIQEELVLYAWRQEQSEVLISYSWIRLQPQNQKEVTFFLQPMQKLASLKDIPVVKANRVTAVISKIFKGFAKLYQHFGPFQLSQEMITFDIFYDPFVWFNASHIKNQYTRDHISENHFAANILYILLKNDHKFENQNILQCCTGLINQERSLNDISEFFLNYHKKEVQSMKSVSQQSTLNFNRGLRLKRKQNLQSRTRKIGSQNEGIFHSVLNEDGTVLKKNFQKSPSLNIEPIQDDNDESSQADIQLKFSLEKQISEGKSQQAYKQQLFLPPTEELQISIDFEGEPSPPKEIVELQKLSRLKRVLTTSINMND